MAQHRANVPVEGEILERIDRLEKAVFGSGRAKARSKPAARSSATLPEHILEARDSGFFNPAKTPSETHAYLKGRYPCDPDRIAMALLRLQRRKKLRKTSKSIDGRRHVAYVW